MLKRTLNDDICQVRFQIRKVSVLSLVDSATTMGRTVIGHLEAINWEVERNGGMGPKGCTMCAWWGGKKRAFSFFFKTKNSPGMFERCVIVIEWKECVRCEGCLCAVDGSLCKWGRAPSDPTLECSRRTIKWCWRMKMNNQSALLSLMWELLVAVKMEKGRLEYSNVLAEALSSYSSRILFCNSWI